MQVLEKAKIIYEAMEERADGNLFQGFSTHLTASLGISTPYYTAVFRELKRMGCVEQVRRGGGSSPSVWRLIQPPTEELIAATRANVNAEGVATIRRTMVDVLAQQIQDLNRRVSDLEMKVQNG